MPIAGKRVNIFKKQTDDKPYVSLDKTNNEDQSDNECSDAGSEEGELRLVVDLRGQSKSASDEDTYETSGTSAHTGGCAGLEGASVVL